MKIITDEYLVEIDDSPKTQKKVFDAIINFLKEHDCFAGEVFSQSDDCQIGAMELLPEIIDDIIKPKVEYKE